MRRAVFWASAGLLVYAQLGYPLLLAALARGAAAAEPRTPAPTPQSARPPLVASSSPPTTRAR